MSSAEQAAWHDYAQARLARAGGLLDEALERVSRAAVPAIHLREMESASREAAMVINKMMRDKQ